MEVVFTQLAEHVWRVVFELEIILGGRRQLIPDAIKRREFSIKSGGCRAGTHISNEYLWLAQ